MEAPSEPVQAEEAQSMPKIKGEVRLFHVSFGYETDNMVLEDIDLTVHPSEVIALVGPSGVGKTTMVNLIPRFFDPSEGNIEIDGQRITDVTLKSLRSQIGLVPQETFLFGGTIAENIAYGNPNT
jgi:ATP-binding cassette subfamily B protein